MITSCMTRRTVPSAEMSPAQEADHGEGARYDRALARREIDLREALAEVQGLRRRHDEVKRQSQNVVSTLFATRETAACRIATLTPREQEILELVLLGRPSKVIAWELGISQRTVENHRASVMRKTGTKSVPALARLAVAAAWNGASEPAVPSAAAGGNSTGEAEGAHRGGRRSSGRRSNGQLPVIAL